ncbi:DinB family protein [uncultured Lacinutrix sp.]|uniref:DinB family protein n=1 Tax=uncultured Lacinutrix sp. TaxID=574032 RepID=UPI002620D976|nr:DUF664 domain-containing protein [uncultured Lacinutrix sp.]
MKTIKCIILTCLLSIATHAQKEVKEISRDWTSFSQFLDIESKTKKKFKVIASVKVDTEDKQAWAGVWARVDNKEETGFFDNMGDRPVKINEWKSYTVEGVIDENSKRLNFGGLCLMNGKFYFDNYKLFIENDKGVLEEVPVDNFSFETSFSNNVIPKWNQGISKGKTVKVKEYKVTTTADAVEGNSALLIEGSGIKPTSDGTIGNVEGASPQIAAMISMLEDLKERVERRVKNMSQYEIDHLHDEKANRIGALIMHLAAAEKFYQVFTFEGRMFNEEEKKKWDVALNLDQGGRDEFKGHDVQYYLDIYNEVRAKTIEELKKRDDKWFQEIQPAYGWSNHYCWFHVMEHQSSHLGQILFLAKRIPPEAELKLPENIKD